jgi:hypothetical protein
MYMRGPLHYLTGNNLNKIIIIIIIIIILRSLILQRLLVQAGGA